MSTTLLPMSLTKRDEKKDKLKKAYTIAETKRNFVAWIKLSTYIFIFDQKSGQVMYQF